MDLTNVESRVSLAATSQHGSRRCSRFLILEERIRLGDLPLFATV
jgi:hypothetical protein